MNAIDMSQHHFTKFDQEIKTKVKALREVGLKAPYFIPIKVTPETAKAIIEYSEKHWDNRKSKVSSVDRYAAMMEAGEWSNTNGETIKMDKNGVLKDGTHRLKATVKANVPVNFVVAWGVDEDAALTIDTGTSRTSGDLLTMQGVLNAHGVSALLNIIRGYRAGSLSNPSTKLDALNMNKIMEDLEDDYGIDIEEIEKTVGKSGPYWRQLGCTPAAASATMLLIRNAGNKDISEIFFNGIKDRVDIPRNDARLPLLKPGYLKSAGLVNGPQRGLNQMCVIIKAWNAYIQCKPVSKAYTTKLNEVPKIVKYTGPLFTPKPGLNPPKAGKFS